MNANLRPCRPVPWWGKIAAKLILARIPVDYKSGKVALIRVRPNGRSSYAYGVFKRHYDAARSRRTFNKFVGLELGPGDSLFTAMIANAYGHGLSLVDVEDICET